jgi:uncharacterized iron-regulated membrane protein
VRKVLFWAHLGIGVVVSLLILFFSVTGSILAYEAHIVRAADRRSYPLAAEPQSVSRLPLDTLVASGAAAIPVPIDRITVYRDVRAPVELQAANRSVFLVDPYSSKVQGPASPRLRSFFATVTGLHRWFGLANRSHAAATLAKGAATLALMFLLVSGAVLWIPKQITKASLRGSVVPRFDVGGRARNYNWHKVTGLWIGAPLAVIATTGVIMAYPWANAALFRMAHSPLPQRRAERPGRRPAAALPTRLDEAFAQATSGVNDWQSVSLQLTPGSGELSFSVDRSEGGHPEKRVQVALDQKTLRVTRLQPFAALNRGQQWRSWVRFVHTGEAGGWWGETLALLTACGACVLSVTGLALFLNRVQRWRRGSQA